MSEINPLIHPAARLRLCSMLATVESVEFVTLANQLAVSDSVLSKHLAALSEAGYLKLVKSKIDSRRTTWVSLTRTGRKALTNHLAALAEIITEAGHPIG